MGQINLGLTNVVPMSILIACLEQSADTINFKCRVRNPESSQRHAGEAHDLKLWRESVARRPFSDLLQRNLVKSRVEANGVALLKITNAPTQPIQTGLGNMATY